MGLRPRSPPVAPGSSNDPSAWRIEEQERLDKKAEKLISGKEFAKMLRERPELKTLVARLTKRALSRMKKKMMRR